MSPAKLYLHLESTAGGSIPDYGTYIPVPARKKKTLSSYAAASLVQKHSDSLLS